MTLNLSRLSIISGRTEEKKTMCEWDYYCKKITTTNSYTGISRKASYHRGTTEQTAEHIVTVTLYICDTPPNRHNRRWKRFANLKRKVVIRKVICILNLKRIDYLIFETFDHWFRIWNFIWIWLRIWCWYGQYPRIGGIRNLFWIW